jgi:lipopolysaccharide biosynthesis protein
MRVLFYVEPLVERENPTWKAGWIEYFVKKISAALTAEGIAETDLACVVPSALETVGRNVLPRSRVVSIDQTELVPRFGRSSLDVATAWYKGTASDEDLQEMAMLVQSRLGDFVPTCCVTLSPAPFLKTAWRDVPVLHMECGLISRPPYPETVYFDPHGMHSEGALSIFAAALRNRIPSMDEQSLLSDIRHRYCSSAPTQANPLVDLLTSALAPFDAAVLLALQFSNFYAYDADALFPDQYDLLVHTLNSVPRNVAVVVCEHPEHAVLHPQTVTFLRSQYPNFIWHPQFREVYGTSHYIMPFVQGVVTVSSSVGLQALLWQKKLAVLGSGHLAAVCDTRQLSELPQLLGKNWDEEKDRALCWLLSSFHLPFDSLLASGRISKYFMELGSHKDGAFEHARSIIGLDVPKIRQFYDSVWQERSELATALNNALADRADQTASLTHAVAERDGQISSLHHAVAERDGQISSLHHAVAERDGQISSLHHAVAERDGQIASLTHAVAERDGQIASLTHAVAERDGQIASLTHAVAERDGQIASLTHAVAERDGQIASLNFRVDALLNSTSWRLTSPLRYFRRIVLGWHNHKLRRIITKLVRATWRNLPLPIAEKQRLKNLILSKTPYIFPGTGAYQYWRSHQLEFARQATKLTKLAERGSIDWEASQTPPRGDLDLHVSSAENQSAPQQLIPVVDFDDTNEEFSEYTENSKLKSIVKLIAFYLPQFHPFEENDRWWGKGFTEWTNVTKATPNFTTHYQPHLPIHFGFYDLRISEVIEEQSRVAQNYGIYGFNYYFYWFAGKTLMETPLLKMLENPNIQMPFMLTWANENWTRRWDGAEHEILIEQQHSDEDSLKFIRHVMKYFHDKRYIKIDGKPLLMVYRASLIPNLKAVVKLWRREVETNGFPGLYLISAQSFGIQGPEQFDFDASAEFPPHTVEADCINEKIDKLDPNFRGMIYSYEQVVKNAIKKNMLPYKCFRTIMLGWDNTARKKSNSHIFWGFSLKLYKQWLSHLCHSVCLDERFSQDEKIVFVNAWNEWAEGTHLEPDRKYGFGYLSSTHDVVKNFRETRSIVLGDTNGPKRQRDYALIAHIHYPNNLEEISNAIKDVAVDKLDLYFTSSNPGVLEFLKDRFPQAASLFVENRGRDVLPFIDVYKTIHSLGYKAICKVHGKRSVYRSDGDKIRNDLFSGLLGNPSVFSKNLALFEEDDKVGLVVVPRYFIKHTSLNMTYNKENVTRAAKKMGLSFAWDNFPAGSMFWFKPEALTPLLSIKSSDFELEEGKADGTFAHAIERLITATVKSRKFLVVDTDGNVLG